MYRSVYKESKSINYIISIILFLIAGLCQYFDNLVSGFWGIVLGDLAHSIFILILIVWYISIKERIMEKSIRRYLLMIAMLLLLLMVSRFIKYNLVDEYGSLKRFLWYVYYIPICFIPVLSLLCSLQVDHKQGDNINKYWHLFFIPSIIISIIFLTNDYHQLCFTFKPNFENYDSYYKHNTIYYLTLIYNTILSFCSIGIFFHKCRVSAVKKKIWIPLSILIITLLFQNIAYLSNLNSYKLPELLCLVIIDSLEGLILIGFIPSNYNYKKYFYLTNINTLISDENLNIYAYSNNYSDFSIEQLEKIKEYGSVTIGNYRYRQKKINGGYVFWVEDLTTINYLNNEIQEIMSELVGENDLLEAENALKEESASIDEQNKLYHLIEKTTKTQVKKVKKLLKCKEEEIDNNLKLACIYTTYIKRRSNLIILNEKDNKAHIDELTFAIKESLNYLSFYGVSCSFINLKKDKMYDIEIINIIYDFFEESIEKALPSLNGLIIRFTEKNNILNVRLCLANPRKLIDLKWNEEILAKYHSSIEIINESEDDNDYILLKMEVE